MTEFRDSGSLTVTVLMKRADLRGSDCSYVTVSEKCVFNQIFGAGLVVRGDAGDASVLEPKSAPHSRIFLSLLTTLS